MQSCWAKCIARYIKAGCWWACGCNHSIRAEVWSRLSEKCCGSPGRWHQLVHWVSSFFPIFVSPPVEKTGEKLASEYYDFNLVILRLYSDLFFNINTLALIAKSFLNLVVFPSWHISHPYSTLSSIKKLWCMTNSELVMWHNKGISLFSMGPELASSQRLAHTSQNGFHHLQDKRWERVASSCGFLHVGGRRNGKWQHN